MLPRIKPSMSVEDFFSGGFENLSSDEETQDIVMEESAGSDDDMKKKTVNKKEKKKTAKSKKSKKLTQPEKMETDSDEELDDVEVPLNEEEEDDMLAGLDVEETKDSDVELEDSDNDEEEKEEEEDQDSSEDDDAEAGDDKQKLKKDAARHKKELEMLKERDPEFFKFLEKEDGDLLDFDLSEDEDVEGNEDEALEGDENQEGLEAFDSDEESDVSEAEEERTSGELPVVTMAMVNEWIKEVEQSNNLRVMKKLFAAFKSAARMSDEEQEETANYACKIVDPNVFSRVITATLRLAPVVFEHNLKGKKENTVPMQSSRWIYIKSTVKSYLNNVLHLLKNLTDSNMLCLAIREAEKCTQYWACFPRSAKEYIKVMLNLWSSFTSSDTVRIQSFLAIRSLALVPVRVQKNSSETYLDICLKNTYLTFVRNCKTTNAHTLPAINLMRNLAVELFGINQQLSYQQAFVYIRQLAIHLRGAMQLKTSASYQSVYNWQYIHCIDFWANVLARHCQVIDGQEESALQPLIYPLVQVALGTVRLIPTAQYYPVRFHILRSLIPLASSAGAFIPLAPYILEVFESAEVKNKAKPSTQKPLEWNVYIKAPKQYLHGLVYQTGILEQVDECLNAYFKACQHHIAFPETVIPAIVTIKRFVKRTKNIKAAKKLHHTAQKLEAKSKFILLQRSKIDFAPVDDAKVTHFMADMKQKLQ
ncbi:Noc2p family-domain-containing protein [Radiomyces spectabilis]|uniref:Noc2p family-domain-containing protein n=1 Tax=Radiomyces spectabilis TaxID=64574 RepID=UPI00221F06A7|nr:Noc2p family-domain-containing protein [Radiomyces spectabilis]KAI8367548.1 Noc2p family-domain-containing protein [Radiomyces spectabilis]